MMLAQTYWNDIGSTKDFEDPLYLDKLSPFLAPQSKILEYGCGYGRLMQLLNSKGYPNLIGFDYSKSMIERGKQTFPHLDLHLLQASGIVPCPNESVDAVVMSTVLCCIVDTMEQVKLIAEIRRILKRNGILYLSDFLICDHPRYVHRYAEGFQSFGVKGIYTTNENLTVRHMTSKAIMELLKDFDIQWFEQFDFKTMNQNPARTFHCIAQA